MKIYMFYHSLVSDWNHGNAHFLRGIATELQFRGHEVKIYEPEESWSRANLIKDHTEEAVQGFYKVFPHLQPNLYRKEALDPEELLRDADLVIMHEWNDHDLVSAIGKHRSENDHYRLLFHDTHHRSITKPEEMAKYDLRHYDGVLAYGEVIADIYRNNGWNENVWVWHEAADTQVFQPIRNNNKLGDVVWVGNWGDEERTQELHEYLIEPVKKLGLKAKVYGVRYPEEGLRALEEAGIEYGGYLPNYNVPEVFSQYRITVHVPRRPYVQSLPGIPTIRLFEAMACGIPLISSPWEDREGLFRPGEDFLMVNNGEEMADAIKQVLENDQLCLQLRQNGLETIQNNHTCKHRVDELMSICSELSIAGTKKWAEERITSDELRVE